MGDKWEHAKLLEFLENEKIYYIDLQSKMAMMNNDTINNLYFKTDLHFNKKGHQLAGFIIAHNLWRRGFFE